MSNLVKCSNIVIKDDDKLVIDSNKMVDAILAQQKKGFGQRAEQEDADGFICGLDAATVEQLVNDGIASKISLIGEESQAKLQDTMQKIVNDSNGATVCIII